MTALLDQVRFLFHQLLAFWPVAALVAAAVMMCILPRTGRAAFARRDFLTGNELEFLGRLERSLPELRIHAQVSMGALLKPGAGQRTISERRRHYAARGRFSQKIADFVLQDRRTGEVVAVVELDDRTHDAGKDARRDAMLKQAGYRTIRWHSRTKPTREQIRERVFVS